MVAPVPGQSMCSPSPQRNKLSRSAHVLKEGQHLAKLVDGRRGNASRVVREKETTEPTVSDSTNLHRIA